MVLVLHPAGYPWSALAVVWCSNEVANVPFRDGVAIIDSNPLDAKLIMHKLLRLRNHRMRDNACLKLGSTIVIVSSAACFMQSAREMTTLTLLTLIGGNSKRIEQLHE